MANNPKFAPQQTPIENYNQGIVNWSFCTMKYDKPMGPKVSQYDPYYMYSVTVDMNGQQVDHIWFVNVDEHNKIQMAGAVKGSTIACTYVMDGKRKGLVVMHSVGPVSARDENEVIAATNAALATLNNPASDVPQAVLPPPQPNYPQQARAPQPPGAPPDPFAGYSPTPPTQAPPAQAPPAQAPPAPPQPPAPPPAQAPAAPPAPAPNKPKQPPAPPKKPAGPSYVPLTAEDFEAFKVVWADNARLHLWAYHTLLDINQEMDLPKITPANVRELATSITIETWRQLGKGRSPLRGLTIEAPPVTADTREGALELINDMDLSHYEIPSEAIRDWLRWTAQAHKHIGAWQHAGNIADIFGLDSEVLISEWDTDNMLRLTQAIWYYEDQRKNEGLSRDDALFLVSQEYDIPSELMQFENDPTS